MDPRLLQEVIKGGVSVILSIGIIWILHLAIVGDGEDRRFLQDHMARQTDALERLVRIYAGES